MKFFSKILTIFFTLIFMTSCRENEEKYNLNIISHSFQHTYESMSSSESNDKFFLTSAADYAQYLNSDTVKSIKNVTVMDDNVTSEIAQEIMEICKKENIPVFFFMPNIDRQTFKAYDKAFAVCVDYEYFGELFARKIHQMWLEDIVDKNQDQIFNFTVIKPESISIGQEIFYDSLLKNIELLGVPLEKLDEVTLSVRDAGAYCNETKDANEGFIILDGQLLSAVCQEYQPFGEKFEIFGINYGLENSTAQYSFAKTCFVDYGNFFSAKKAILNNIENKEYPFKDINYSISDKNIYIEPTI